MPDSAKERQHSHNFIVSAKIGTDSLNKMQVVTDFNRARKMLEEITLPLQGKGLIENQYFKENSSTAEMIAKYIYDNLQGRLAERLTLDSITITEEPNCSAEYRP